MPKWRKDTVVRVVEMPYPWWKLWRRGEVRPRKVYASAFVAGDIRLVDIEVENGCVTPVFMGAGAVHGVNMLVTD